VAFLKYAEIAMTSIQLTLFYVLEVVRACSILPRDWTSVERKYNKIEWEASLDFGSKIIPSKFSLKLKLATTKIVTQLHKGCL
jgi:hypothetical protein